MNWGHQDFSLNNDIINHREFEQEPPEIVNNTLIEDTLLSNLTLADCRHKYANITTLLSSQYLKFCKASFDRINCWPPTIVNETVSIRCFSEFNNIKYDDKKFVSRICTANSTWLPPDYENCEFTPPELDLVYYFVGYSISLVALAIAIFVFTYFKELRCLRNTIHLHLMWSHFLTHFMWILTLILLEYGANMSIICKFDVILLHYFYVTTFFWMFVEGLYLYILVVKTLSRDSFKLRVYVSIGWGIPVIAIVIWAVSKSIISDVSQDMFATSCQWFEYHAIDWIFLSPAFIVLLLNLVFLFSIMCVLITKLRSATTAETTHYHKATKALVVLIPLLGITYVITIYAPTPDKSSTFIFDCIRAILLSTQGFVVALFYCFLNSEVQKTLHHHFDNWKANRSLGSHRLRSSRHRLSSSRHTEWTLMQGDEHESHKLAPLTNGSEHNGEEPV